jgi:hypothetical protein
VDEGVRGLWDDVSANLARLVAAGPPAEEAAMLPEAEAEEVETTLLPAQEQVSTTAIGRCELTLVSRSHVTNAGRGTSPVLGVGRALGRVRRVAR